ncbi:MAG: DUF4125 family protein [Desulfobacterales bacterium]|nr:DUF4125 family protein [Desulfobacterales bacterium]
MVKKQELIQKIIDRELHMFLNVPARESASCQENPRAFRFYRGVSFSVWSEAALESYLDDLTRADAKGLNLLTLKYARMENSIPPLSENPLIDQIVEIEIAWIKELAAKYPNLHSRGRPIDEGGSMGTSVKTYLRGELETYSDDTLALYYQNQIEFLERKENLPEKVLLATVVGAGYGSLQEAEDRLLS